MKKDTWVLVTGSAFDGLKLHGPFKEVEKAETYALNHYASDDWDVVLVNPPDLNK